MLAVRLPARGRRMVRPIVTVLIAWQRNCPKTLDSPSIVRLTHEALIGELHSLVVDTLRIVNHARRFATKAADVCHRTIRPTPGGWSTTSTPSPLRISDIS